MKLKSYILASSAILLATSPVFAQEPEQTDEEIKHVCVCCLCLSSWPARCFLLHDPVSLESLY